MQARKNLRTSRIGDLYRMQVLSKNVLRKSLHRHRRIRLSRKKRRTQRENQRHPTQDAVHRYQRLHFGKRRILLHGATKTRTSSQRNLRSPKRDPRKVRGSKRELSRAQSVRRPSVAKDKILVPKSHNANRIFQKGWRVRNDDRKNV